MKAKINGTLIKRLTPESKEYEVHDIDLRGFAIRVFPSGVMCYFCQYGRGKKIKIGAVGVMTPSQAREKAVEILNNVHNGIEPQSKKRVNKPTKLEEFIENEYKSWILSHHKRAKKTIATLYRCFNKLFSKQLSEITPSIIDQWRIKRLNEGISSATVNRDIGTLKSLLTKATEWGFIKENPLKNLKMYKIDRSPKVRYLSLEEESSLRRVLFEREEQFKKKRKNANEWRESRGYTLFPDFDEDESCNYLMPMVLLSINTGLRQGELFHLTWRMVDLAERSIIISGEVTKNSSSRFIPLNNESNKILQNLFKNRQPDDVYVFTSKNGLAFNNVNKSWLAVLKKAKISNFRWHDLRHHFASKLVMAGVDLNTVRELLGHSDLQMTLRYAHLAPEHKIKAVKKIDWTLDSNDSADDQPLTKINKKVAEYNEEA
ncbi:MAG: site-specific integrase [Legionella sp.]|jgi:integrase